MLVWLIFNHILVDHADFVRIKRSFALTGIRNLTEIVRFQFKRSLSYRGKYSYVK